MTFAPLTGTELGFQFCFVDQRLFAPPPSQVCAPSPLVERAKRMVGPEWRVWRRSGEKMDKGKRKDAGRTHPVSRVGSSPTQTLFGHAKAVPDPTGSRDGEARYPEPLSRSRVPARTAVTGGALRTSPARLRGLAGPNAAKLPADGGGPSRRVSTTTGAEARRAAGRGPRGEPRPPPYPAKPVVGAVGRPTRRTSSVVQLYAHLR